MRTAPGNAKTIIAILLTMLLLVGCSAPAAAGPTEAAPTLPALVSDHPEDWATAASGEFRESGNLPALNPGGTVPNMSSPAVSTQPQRDPLQPDTQPTTPPTPDTPTMSAPTESAQTPSVPIEEGDDDSSENADVPKESEDSSEDGPELSESPLQGELAEAIEKLDGSWSVYAKNLDTGETALVNDRPMVAASLIKLFVAGAYYETDPQAADAAWCSRTDLMISVSSNDACNALIDRLGMDAINRFIRARGCENTELNRKMLEQNNQENYTSALECGTVLEAIVNGEYVSPAASARLLENLKAQERTGKIPAGVPEGIETANKTGELSDTENDACIVWSRGGTYILCVMACDQTNVVNAREEIIALSQLVYRYFNT